MPCILTNKNIKLIIDFPLENYNYSRFDWTGKIVELHYKGIQLTSTEELNASNQNTLGKGLYNEFGIDSPLGFKKAGIGSWFHKIGVGLLKKEDSYYDFQKGYPIKPPQFKVLQQPFELVIQCESAHLNGYGYFLQKKIVLLENGFSIKYYLENKGVLPIITSEYNHNFLSINNQTIGEDYILTFPFEIDYQNFGENVNPDGVVSIEQNGIKFLGNPKNQFFFSNLTGGKKIKASWKLENIASKIGISEIVDFETDSINLWGWKHVISPELFINLNIKPGESKEWMRNYEVYELE